MIFLSIFLLSLAHGPSYTAEKDKAFNGKYLFEASRGVYTCIECTAPLFHSNDKYDSGSGWPSFTKPITPKTVFYLEDWDLPFKRYKVLCRGCNSSLGHVFNDGPPPKGLRYTINSSTLNFTNHL